MASTNRFTASVRVPSSTTPGTCAVAVSATAGGVVIATGSITVKVTR